MIDKYLSDKLRAISFILIILVVLCHSNNFLIKFNSESVLLEQGFNTFIQNFISLGIAKIASPLFFIIAGYFFFLSIKKGSIPEFFSKYQKRVRTLVLPYLLWTTYGVLFYLTLQSIPLSKPFFTSDLIVDLSFAQILSKIFINPIPYQLWFIRDLIVLIIISPILYWLIKRLKFYIIFILFFAWLYNFNYVIFTSRALFFFSFGALLSIQGIKIQNSKLNNQYVFFIFIWMILLLIKTTLNYNHFENGSLISLFHNLSILFGILSIWFLYDRIFEKIDISKTKIYLLFQFTFFLYAFHEPVLTIFTKTFYYIIGISELSSFIIYLIAPTFTIFVSILIGYFTKRYIPKYYYLMTGGR